MARNIKDPEADRLVRELAAITGESITDAAKAAFAERLHRVRAQTRSPETSLLLDAIIARGRSRAIIDARSADDILGYDSSGLPTS